MAHSNSCAFIAAFVRGLHLLTGACGLCHTYVHEVAQRGSCSHVGLAVLSKKSED